MHAQESGADDVQATQSNSLGNCSSTDVEGTQNKSGRKKERYRIAKLGRVSHHVVLKSEG